MKRFIKDNWLFLLFTLPFVLICIQNRSPENDIWFILNNGKYIFNHGIPHTDPFTIHEGLSYVMQQWLTSALFWSILSNFKKYGIIILIHVMSLFLMYIYYRLLLTVSQKKKLSIILTTVTFTLMSDFIGTRPQIFTYLILLIELLQLEKYTNSKDFKHLLPLPVLSCILSNVHASMWFFQLIFLLPYVLNTIKLKKITVDEIKLKPIVIVAVAMFIGGFINPYGMGAVTYIFKSYGTPIINETIVEMAPLTFEDYHFKLILCLLFSLFYLLTFQKKTRLDIRHFLFICGTSILAFMHLKGYPYFIMIFFYCLAYMLKDFKLEYPIENKYFKACYKGIRIGLIIMLPISFFLTVYYSVTNYNFKNRAIDDIGQYLSENYVKEDIVLYVDYNNGGYTEYLGIKSYIDPRAELFFKKFNGKEDIFFEYYASIHNRDFDFDFFLERYNFTHLIVDADTNLDDYMKNREDYELVYTQSSGLRKLYVLR